MLSDRQIAKKLQMSYDTLLRWKKEKTLLYHHIRDGFELKELALEMDVHLKAIYRQTQFIRLKERVSEQNERRYRVVQCTLIPGEAFENAEQLYWARTDDTEALNVLLGQEELEFIENEMFINIFDFEAHSAEDESEWLISNNLHIHDINDFFKWYFILHKTASKN